MLPKIVSTSLEGGSGASEKINPTWLGWSGNFSHPDSPTGGGGPGGFAQVGPFNQQGDTDPNHPSQLKPGPQEGAPTQSPMTPKPPKQPPATNPRSLGSKKSVQNSLVDVSIDAEIIADGSSSTTKTSFNLPPWNAPDYKYDNKSGNITKFNGKFTWKGTITIQTVYDSGSSPTHVSCYGRGTTASDVQTRNITLGFHEHCHQVDFENFLNSNKLPDPPKMQIGMSKTSYDAEVKRFEKEFKNYEKNMEKYSWGKTDEVGHKKSTWKKTGKCFVHQTP